MHRLQIVFASVDHLETVIGVLLCNSSYYNGK
jgi:hypothetical protein